MQNWKFFFFSFCLFLFAFLFSIYSYSQLDLNLTLSSNPIYQSLQYQLTQLGYFNRPLSTMIFVIILGGWVGLYAVLFFRTDPDFSVKKNQPVRPNPVPSPFARVPTLRRDGAKQDWYGAISIRHLWFQVLGTSILLLFSYPAFAHDIFNYMFDARIVVKYLENPWIKTPLDFPTDEWTRFMRWTHVTSVYPPGWIATTIPFYLLGMGKFTLTLLSFKFMGLLAFLGSSWLMLQLAGTRAWILWSFNPMVLIESLSSVHNEIVMVFFTLLAFWVYRNRDKVRPWRTPGSDLLNLKRPGLAQLKGSDLSGRSDPSRGLKGSDLAARSDPLKRMGSYLLLIWAGLIKYSSFLLLPFLNNPFRAALAAWISAVIFIAIREVNPWYILLPVAMSFATNHKPITNIAVLLSIAVMYRYYPCVAVFSC